METKLTLKLNQAVIDSAKIYAKKNKKSLSSLVESFFRDLTHDNNAPGKYPLLINRLSGVISEKDLDKLSRDDEKARHILRKDR